MTIDELTSRLDAHVTGTILPQITDDMTRFGAGFLVGTGRIRNTAAALLAKAGVVGENGEVDLAAIRAGAVKAFEHTPKISVGGLKFDLSDADAFLKTLN